MRRKTHEARTRVIADALTDCIAARDKAAALAWTIRAELAIAEDALEAERQWRLTSLPALLAAEAKVARVQEERDDLAQQIAHLKRVGYAGPGYALVRIDTDDRPWAAPTKGASDVLSHDPRLAKRLAAAYHAETERP